MSTTTVNTKAAGIASVTVSEKDKSQAKELLARFDYIRREGDAVYRMMKNLPSDIAEQVDRLRNTLEFTAPEDIYQEKVDGVSRKVWQVAGEYRNPDIGTINGILKFVPMNAKTANTCWKALSRCLIFLHNAGNDAGLAAAIHQENSMEPATDDAVQQTVSKLFVKVTQAVETFAKAAEYARYYEALTGEIKVLKRK